MPTGRLVDISGYTTRRGKQVRPHKGRRYPREFIAHIDGVLIEQEYYAIPKAGETLADIRYHDTARRSIMFHDTAGDRGTLSGDIDNPHIAAVIVRAKRQGAPFGRSYAELYRKGAVPGSLS